MKYTLAERTRVAMTYGAGTRSSRQPAMMECCEMSIIDMTREKIP